MPENRKYFVNKTTHFVTARTEEGLPIVASLLLNFIIWGILARARSMYQVRVCHFLFMSNHFHALLVVDNPEHVSPFVGYVKCEIAHAINRLLGRRRKTIWVEGYDSPPLLTPHDVLRYITYIYRNPAKANLVDSIEQFPGVSSWQMFTSDTLIKHCKRVIRPLITRLALPALSVNEQKRMVEEYKRQLTEHNTFVLEPFAWVECFPEFRNADIETLKGEIISNLQAQEQVLRQERKRLRKDVIGATSLRRQSMLKEYQPKKFSKKMICICSDIELRKRYISFYRGICETARRAYQRWKRGDLVPKIPPGLLSPRIPSFASAISCIA